MNVVDALSLGFFTVAGMLNVELLTLEMPADQLCKRTVVFNQ